MEVLLYTILTLCALGVLSAVILYFVAQKFRVEEDPRIDEVEKMLPGANCGGCGFAGCRGMADALVKQDDISSLFCPVGGGDCMKAVRYGNAASALKNTIPGDLPTSDLEEMNMIIREHNQKGPQSEMSRRKIIHFRILGNFFPLLRIWTRCLMNFFYM